jgi:ammonium transporter Rh
MAGRGKFNMVHIQNATLAGGVAIGSSSDLVVGPGGAIFIGALAGMLSVYGFHHISPMLHEKLGLHDTCGVHNLHGLPGLLGGLCGAFTCAMASENVYGAEFSELFSEGRTPETQWPYQIYALLVTLAFAICGGTVCGMVMRMMANGPAKPFRDDSNWAVEAGLPAP